MPKGAVAAVAARMKQQRNVEKVRKLFSPQNNCNNISTYLVGNCVDFIFPFALAERLV